MALCVEYMLRETKKLHAQRFWIVYGEVRRDLEGAGNEARLHPIYTDATYDKIFVETSLETNSMRVNIELAREAVRKRLVLLKNGEASDKPLLPLPKKATKILVTGTHADTLGYQCGGWTITWQGLSGNDLTAGTTILQAVKNTVDRSTQVLYSQNPDAQFVKSGKFSHAIVVVGEPPYAETNGDSLNLTISQPGPDTIYNVCGAMKCVVDVISGRPVVMQPYVSSIDALVAAWLPGTEGQGVADVLFGNYGFTGKQGRGRVFEGPVQIRIKGPLFS
ncbi:hypothetical protein F3Y22_tig00000340pilonHSYRG00658 [Hibiscus syriacus]|uniref:beta-glucosidase n=1 Tax=Hibiscus syriacus TaxID=106335 RepID=A0A6A3D8K5_HIBSY|nr:periplasmic beta-glucosidase-like [Hibiscus syriacus]KAE8735572.1 hypothetical protein F3Y22_tig00000340pilonHSYRG00658 [Hibiscus syriacus]